MRTAAYARYSSDQQSAASLDDQLRNCRAFCNRQGWPTPVVYSDAAMSGARNDRPGYLRLLADVGRFDVIIVDDLSRLSRDSIEVAQAIRRLTFRGVRVIGVSDSLDTSRDDSKINASLRGLMGEIYLDDLRKKTHRGLKGRAIAGASAGGLPYGYRVTEVGQRSIDEAQASIVRRVFAEYLQGMTPRAIAAGLNRDGVPASRGGTWAMTAIHGDVRRGIGMLVNPIYVGRPVWNRSRWVKHPETGRRVRQERPESEWVRQDLPELAIVSAATWNAVQARLRGCSAPTGSAGRPMRHLLSGLLRCGECGGPLVVVDAYNYGCATARDRSTCPSRVRLRRKVVEHALLAGVRDHLLSDAAFQRFQRALRAELKQAAPNPEAATRALADAERELTNVMAAIRAGIITPSTKAEVLKAEAAVNASRSTIAAQRQVTPERIIPRARDEWNRIVATLADASRNLPQARTALQSLIGTAIVRNENGALFAEIAGSHIAVVAGAGSVLYLHEPLLIPLRRA